MSKIMKKAVVLLLALLMAVSVTACGGSPGESGSGSNGGEQSSAAGNEESSEASASGEEEGTEVSSGEADMTIVFCTDGME